MFRRKSGYVRGLAITLCVFALLVAGALWVLDFIDNQSARAEEELVRGAVRQAINAVNSGFCEDIKANVSSMLAPKEENHAE